MAMSVMKSVSRRRSSIPAMAFRSLLVGSNPLCQSFSTKMKGKEDKLTGAVEEDIQSSDEELFPTAGISRPLSEILKDLNKKVPDSLIRVRNENNGFVIKHIPWHVVNRIMNLHAPADGKSVSVIYRVTIYGTDAEIYRESTGTELVAEAGYGDPVQKAESMAFRRACARFGLGLHLYHEDIM